MTTKSAGRKLLLALADAAGLGSMTHSTTNTFHYVVFGGFYAKSNLGSTHKLWTCAALVRKSPLDSGKFMKPGAS